MKANKRTELHELGEFRLIEMLTDDFYSKNPSTFFGVGDDAAILDSQGKMIVASTDLLLEGIHFDLTYHPLKHLGYKAVVVNICDILAMNATPTQITVSIGVSKRFYFEQLNELYDGIRLACQRYGVDLVGGDTSSSLTGMIISVTAFGLADKDRLCYRNGAKEKDLICVTGNLGAAYMGLQLLEREKRVLDGNTDVRPQLEGYSYVLERFLKPEARIQLLKQLGSIGIVPTSMIDISDGLSSELLHICKNSKVGCRIYTEKIPIDEETSKLAQEMGIEPVIAALNGGDDYELLFTLPISMHEKVTELEGVSIIGHITHENHGAKLVPTQGEEVTLTAQGWNAHRAD